MNILQICSKPPYPEKDGYALAVNHITNSLIKKGHTLKVVAISTPKHSAEKVPKQYLKKTDFEHIFIDTTIKIIPAFLNLFCKSAYNTNRFYSDRFAIRLKQILTENNFDIVHFEGLFVCPYLETIKQNSDAKLVFRAHNIESDIWKGIANQENNFLKRSYINLLQKKLLNYEKSIISKIDAIVCISDKDADWMEKQCVNPIITIPFAINTINNEVSKSEKNTIFHIGSMDWKANLDSVKWYLDKVFPLVTQEKDEIVLHLAGRSMPDYFNNFTSKNIIIDGEVENAKSFMGKYNLMIVPLLNGSGIRIKILEGMAMGKTIISTTIGASGIYYQDKKNILIADTAEQFANQIIWCLNNIKESMRIGENAKLNIKENYNAEKISEELDSFFNKILKS